MCLHKMHCMLMVFVRLLRRCCMFERNLSWMVHTTENVKLTHRLPLKWLSKPTYMCSQLCVHQNTQFPVSEIHAEFVLLFLLYK